MIRWSFEVRLARNRARRVVYSLPDRIAFRGKVRLSHGIRTYSLLDIRPLILEFRRKLLRIPAFSNATDFELGLIPRNSNAPEFRYLYHRFQKRRGMIFSHVIDPSTNWSNTVLSRNLRAPLLFHCGKSGPPRFMLR